MQSLGCLNICKISLIPITREQFDFDVFLTRKCQKFGMVRVFSILAKSCHRVHHIQVKSVLNIIQENALTRNFQAIHQTPVNLITEFEFTKEHEHL